MVEILRDAHHAINLPFHQQLAGFAHIVAVSRHVGFGRGIHLADELTAHAAVAVINHGKRHFAHYLVGIDEGVEQRIAQRHEEDENHNTLVVHDLLQLRHPNLYDIYDRSCHYGMYLTLVNKLR